MSSMRRDPPHGVRSGGRSRGVGGVLSVVVPAKDEAASLPKLVEEIARALRPLVAGRRLGGFEVVVVDDGSTDETAGGPGSAGGRIPRAEAGPAGEERGAVGGDGGGLP